MKTCGTMFSTAHPLADADGNLWNVGATMLTGCKYIVFKIPFIGSGKVNDGEIFFCQYKDESWVNFEQELDYNQGS